MSLQAYSKARRATESPRDTEYRLFAEITRRMMDVDGKPLHDPSVIDAIHRNKRLWSTLLADCSKDGNGLPEATRAAIISLAIWVDRHSSGVMRGHEQIIDLIEVNRTIMEGLAQRTVAA